MSVNRRPIGGMISDMEVEVHCIYFVWKKYWGVSNSVASYVKEV